jgi:hypothetical protein
MQNFVRMTVCQSTRYCVSGSRRENSSLICEITDKAASPAHIEESSRATDSSVKSVYQPAHNDHLVGPLARQPLIRPINQIVD